MNEADNVSTNLEEISVPRPPFSGSNGPVSSLEQLAMTKAKTSRMNLR
jgi:hypothetical protein